MTIKDRHKRINIDMVMNHEYFEDVDWDHIGSFEEWKNKTLPFERYFLGIRHDLRNKKYENK